MVTINFPDKVFNFSFPYPVQKILNETQRGNITAIFIETNATMGFLPFRLLMFGLFIVFYGLATKLDPNATRLKSVAYASLTVALLIGVGSFANMITLVDVVPYLIMAGMGAVMKRGR